MEVAHRGKFMLLWVRTAVELQIKLWQQTKTKNALKLDRIIKVATDVISCCGPVSTSYRFVNRILTILLLDSTAF